MTLNTVTDTDFVGIHKVTFLTYRMDYDPSAIYKIPLDGLTLRVKIENPAGIEEAKLEEILSTFVRKAPVMEEEM